LQSAFHSQLGIDINRRSAELIHVRREEMIRFVQKVELSRVASAPLAEPAVEAKPQPRAKRQQTITPLRGQPRHFPAIWRNSPHQIQELDRERRASPARTRRTSLLVHPRGPVRESSTSRAIESIRVLVVKKVKVGKVCFASELSERCRPCSSECRRASFSLTSDL
jgi:hypothetical protein